MLSIYIPIFNYDLVSFLVFWSHFFLFDLCIFLEWYKGHESAQNDAQNPHKWMQTLSQDKEYLL